MEGVSRVEFNGLGTRLAECEQLKPIVRRNEDDIQKIFENLDKIPEHNAKVIEKTNELNQKLLNKVVLTIFVSILLMVAKDFLA